MGGPAWLRGYHLRTVPQRSRVQVPGTHLLKDTETYIPDCACRLQWAIIRCGKHVHADYMSLKHDIDGNIACCQYGTQSKSLCSVLHTPNLTPYLYPNLNHIHLWSMIQVVAM